MTKNNKKNYYRIIPLTRTSLNRDPGFTYSSTKKLNFGDLVKINFSGKNLNGIVVSTVNSKPRYKTKQINKLLHEKILDKKQLALAQEISDYYLTSIGIVLKSFIQKPTKKTNQPENPEIKELLKKSKTIQLTKDQKKAADKIIKSKNQKEFLVTGPASSGKTEVAMKCIENVLKSGRQALVLVPEILLSYQEIQRYLARFSKYKTALYHSELIASEKSFVINQTRTGKLDVIIATKVGCFLPFKKLGMVVVDEEQDVSHKNWDQSPRYHVRQVSRWLAKNHNSKLAFLSATPSAEILNDCQKKKISKISLPALKTPEIKVKAPSFEFVNLKEQYYKNNKKNNFISKPLESSLEELISKKKQIAFILVPRRGKGKALICADCHKKITCPQCNLPLVHSKDSYRCLHCSFKQSDISQCPHCKSFRIFSVGYGTESAVEKIRNILPAARIEIADQDSLSRKNAKKDLYKKIASGKIDILVGTQTIIKGFDFPAINLAACLNAEAFSGKTDFKFDERWLGSLFQVAGRVNRPGSKQEGIFLIQTFNPENSLFEYLKSWDWEKFITEEIKNRKAIGYPPFSRFIKIIYRNSNLKKVEKNTDRVYNQIQAFEDKSILSITPPYFGNIKRINRNYQKFILVKTKIAKKHPLKLKKFLQKLGEGWYFDVDPENIF